MNPNPKEVEESGEFSFEVAGFLLAILGAPCVLAVQAFLWLKTGVWHPASLQTLLSKGHLFDFLYTANDWVGLATIGQWIIEAPLAFVAFLLGMAMIIIGEKIDRKLNKMAKNFHARRNEKTKTNEDDSGIDPAKKKASLIDQAIKDLSGKSP